MAPFLACTQLPPHWPHIIGEDISGASYKDTNPIVGTSSKSLHLPKPLPPNTIILALGLQHLDLRNTSQSHTESARQGLHCLCWVPGQEPWTLQEAYVSLRETSTDNGCWLRSSQGRRGLLLPKNTTHPYRTAWSMPPPQTPQTAEVSLTRPGWAAREVGRWWFWCLPSNEGRRDRAWAVVIANW
jgi:hypothetical protein